MSDRRQLISASPHAALVAIVGSLAGNAAEAQVPPPYPQSQPVQPQQMQMQQPSPLRQVFANTLASVMQGVSTAATAGIVQGVNGSLTNWFDRQQQRNSQQQYQSYPSQSYPSQSYPSQSYPSQSYPSQSYPSQSYPSQTYPSQSYPTQSYPTTPTQSYPQPATDPNAAATSYPTTNYPQYPSSTTSTSTYSTGSTYGYDPNNTPVYDTQTGQYAGNSASTYLTPSSPTSYGSTLYAGVAYEVHAIAQGGSAVPVNPATHAFRTGDQFVVYYRPSMPGRMEVYNVNPFGQQTRIDSVSMAAGQMAKLGPYQFAASKGQESLRLVLMPCSSAELMATTRDIVNVSGNMSGTNTSGGFSLASCTATRSVKNIKTRDITKVAMDGMTGFALDPVSSQEYSSGQLDARDVSIVFHHQ
jgi:hypothetical protein